MERDAQAVAAHMLTALKKLSFPPAPTSSQVTLPVIIGGSLPWMRQ
jgi:hypothetical protein